MTLLAPGYMLKRPDLAQTYKAFAAKGSDALYKGEVGDKLVAFMKKEGGLITKDDLTKYQVKWSQPIQTTYRGYTVYGVPPSSSVNHLDADPQHPRGLRPQGDGAQLRRTICITSSRRPSTPIWTAIVTTPIRPS